MHAKDFKLGIIGVGNMAEAILKCVLSSELLGNTDVTAYEIREPRKKFIKRNYGINFQSCLSDLVVKSRFILIEVKPQDIIKVLEDAKPFINSGPVTIISIAAGVSTALIENKLGNGIPVLRIMPNTPALLNRGMSAISRGRFTGSKDIDFAVKLIKSTGNYIIVDEKIQNTVTAISGSGPAYFFLFCKSLVDAAVKKGVDRKTARILVSSTAAGAGEMLVKFGCDTDYLIKMVASPGGTTEEALKQFENMNISKVIYTAVDIAEKKAIEIQKKLETT